MLTRALGRGPAQGLLRWMGVSPDVAQRRRARYFAGRRQAPGATKADAWHEGLTVTLRT
ncbi:hypothetical protein ACYQR9_01085 [Methylobacterium sp. CM6241]